jgi:cytochrome c556
MSTGKKHITSKSEAERMGEIKQTVHTVAHLLRLIQGEVLINSSSPRVHAKFLGESAGQLDALFPRASDSCITADAEEQDPERWDGLS